LDLSAQLGPVAMLVVVVAAAAGAGFLSWTVMTRLLARAKRTAGTFGDAILRAMRPALSVLAVLAILTPGRGALEALIHGRAGFVERLAIIALVVTAAWGLVRVAAAVLERAANKQPRLQPAARLGGRLLTATIYVAAVLTILAEYGISITPMLTGLGIAALAVGLALQDTLSNFFAGVWIQSGRTLQPGHYVRLQEEKVDGFVNVIGWRTTLVRTLAGNTVVIPNAKLAQAIVTDYAWPTAEQSIVINFRFPYNVPPEEAIAMLVEEAKEAAKTVPGLLAKPEPFANLNPGFADWGLDYALIVRIQHFTNRWDAQSEIRRRVWHRWAQLGIEPPYPARPPAGQHAVTPQDAGPDAAAMPAPGTRDRDGDRPQRPPPPPRRSPPPGQPSGLGQQETPPPPDGRDASPSSPERGSGPR
jgi:small-conductance mechanosensitive channel